jgi:2-amino-4-hydroxy-6-hydroxymethyldihydropteridine diphosphokinase
MNIAVIGLGSNINPAVNIPKAKDFLSQKYHVISESPLIETAPIGTVNQNKFLNGALLITTESDFESFNQSLKEIEILVGREKGHDKSKPRTIDLDIVIWNNKVIHQDFHNRDFVRKSVLELIPDLKW